MRLAFAARTTVFRRAHAFGPVVEHRTELIGEARVAGATRHRVLALVATGPGRAGARAVRALGAQARAIRTELCLGLAVLVARAARAVQRRVGSQVGEKCRDGVHRHSSRCHVIGTAQIARLELILTEVSPATPTRAEAEHAAVVFVQLDEITRVRQLTGQADRARERRPAARAARDAAPTEARAARAFG